MLALGALRQAGQDSWRPRCRIRREGSDERSVLGTRFSRESPVTGAAHGGESFGGHSDASILAGACPIRQFLVQELQRIQVVVQCAQYRCRGLADLGVTGLLGEPGKGLEGREGANELQVFPCLVFI